MLKQKLMVILLAAFFASCSNDNKTAGSENTKDSLSEQETTTTAPVSGPHANIKLVITGGEMAGTYEAVCRESCCSFGIAGDKTFGTQYSEEGKGPKELSSVQMIVNDVTGNKTTDEFTVTFSFGELFGADSKSFTINTAKGHNDGSGTLSLEYAADKASVHLQGKTKDGIGLNLEMECHRVATMESIMKEAQK
ncbi:MAG TPA: hypothetical protein VIQ00_05595 [Chitinophagaceae bacterium]|jgi:hypothetical protein